MLSGCLGRVGQSREESKPVGARSEASRSRFFGRVGLGIRAGVDASSVRVAGLTATASRSVFAL